MLYKGIQIMGKIYVHENKILVDQMIEIYKPQEIDWMSYLITTKNTLTFHHIIEKSKGGLTCIENGALLTKKAHRALNVLAIKDDILYREWNEFFVDLNASKKPMDDYCKYYSSKLKQATIKVLYK